MLDAKKVIKTIQWKETMSCCTVYNLCAVRVGISIQPLTILPLDCYARMKRATWEFSAPFAWTSITFFYSHRELKRSTGHVVFVFHFCHSYTLSLQLPTVHTHIDSDSYSCSLLFIFGCMVICSLKGKHIIILFFTQLYFVAFALAVEKSIIILRHIQGWS